jgi:hypothetical protein
MTKEAWFFCGGGVIAGLVAGMAIGDIAAQTGAGRGAANMFQTLKFTELGDSENRAYQAYQHESIPVAIYALSVSLDKMKEAAQIGETRLLSKEILATDLMLTHARLAKLYEQTGQSDVAAQHLNEALNYAKAGRQTWITNRDSLMNFVAKLDKVAR